MKYLPLILFLFLLVPFHPAFAASQPPQPQDITPTLYCLGSCPHTDLNHPVAPSQGVSTTPNPSNEPSSSPQPSTPNTSTTPATSASPSISPCPGQKPPKKTKKIKKEIKHVRKDIKELRQIKKHFIGKDGFIKKFINFLIQYFERILHKFIKQKGPTPCPSPSPSPSVSPSGSPAPSTSVTPSVSQTPTLSPSPHPSPTPTPGGQPKPVGVSGNWTLVFDDEFSGNSLDKTKWAPNWYGENGNMNNVTTHAANVSVSGGNLILTLANSHSGALVNTDPADAHPGFLLPTGDYAEARISFPGSGTTIDNWPAWWASTSLADGYPSAGENDIAEGLGTLTVNYHSHSGTHNMGTIPGVWSNAFHTYGLWRKTGSAQVYYDGQLVKSYSTDDNGRPEILIINVGSGHTSVFGTGSQVKIDYVRAWK